jgi:M6 family metalloprotease-like protein
MGRARLLTTEIKIAFNQGDKKMSARHLAVIARRVVWPVLLAIGLAGSPFGWQAAAAHPPGPGVPTGPAAPQAVTHPIPRNGDQKLLVVLADFSDRPGLFTGQQWQQALFGPGGLSDYYKEVSYNQLRYTGTVVGISGGVPVTNSASVAYVRLPHPITFYADGGHGFKPDPGQFPKNHSGVVYQALQALDTAGFDFAPYANPLTNNVDNVLVIFGGSTFAYTHDENNSLEATAYRLAWSDGGIYTTQGGQTIDNYTFCPDQWENLSGQIARTGPCAHEHGHGLGDFDLYDFSYTTAGAGNFDNMGTGAYGFFDGTRPVHFSAFSKELFGWITPTVMAPGTITVTLAPAETTVSFVKLAPYGNPGSREYFLLENRQPIGFDQDWHTLGGLCAGLLIWHIDQNIVQNYPFAVNSLASYPGGPPHQGVVLVEADGNYDLIHTPYNTGECADTWATSQTWDDSTTPNAHLWNGNSSGLSVTVVGQAAGAVTVRITTSGYAVQLPLVNR